MTFHGAKAAAGGQAVVALNWAGRRCALHRHTLAALKRVFDEAVKLVSIESQTQSTPVSIFCDEVRLGRARETAVGGKASVSL